MSSARWLAALAVALVGIRCGSSAIGAASDEECRSAGEEREVEGVALCWCPAGKFAMGSPLGEAGRRDDETLVEVTLSRGFWIGKHEVTQGQWHRIVGPLQGELLVGDGDDFPVYWVSWLDAEE